jgi:hypothetical protein
MTLGGLETEWQARVSFQLTPGLRGVSAKLLQTSGFRVGALMFLKLSCLKHLECRFRVTLPLLRRRRSESIALRVVSGLGMVDFADESSTTPALPMQHFPNTFADVFNDSKDERTEMQLSALHM